MADDPISLLREVLCSPNSHTGSRSEPWKGEGVPRGAYRYTAKRLRNDLIERIQEVLREDDRERIMGEVMG